MINQECKVKPETMNINSNEPSFYPYSVKINKFSGNFSNINKICLRKMCFPGAVIKHNNF